MSSIAATLFDLDGTLCQSDQDAVTLYRGSFDVVGIDPFGEPGDLWRALDGPPDPGDELGYLTAGFSAVAAQYDRLEVDASALARGFIETLDLTAVSFHPGAEEALELAGDHGLVGLVTNGPARRQAVKVDALGIANAFDVIIYAGDLPRRKPHADPFDRALAALAIDPDRALHVGDSLEYDVAGAQAAGLLAAWYPHKSNPDPREYTPDFILTHLSELEVVLTAPAD
ncbi:HAD family hydrolase [Haladaptatus sp. YSMS36]|uniref:HAD family hydrolase n=1 Tax=Haladaptatus sp. YSMS36 TaxID=3033384 RepID=UPI0023E7DE11|nr:HAD family hydrolase [Haladaptatus sp. YSMS36]